MASATTMRAMAPASINPLMGCSPHATAVPVVSKCVWAVTATLERGSWRGPTHCCCATNPVTERSTLWTRNRLDPTESNRKTRSMADATVVPSGSESGWYVFAMGLSMYVFCGILPNTKSSGRSTTGVTAASGAESCTTTRPSPVTVPRTRKGQFSRFAILAKSASSSARRRRALFSWYSAPHISNTERVSSPSNTLRTS
mmetsp:Transcript_22338/g.34127  ORF Transcript_22338/g.34127 Transcript_22338/m.34127 type:complete len:200 (-) Transcript_22338:255-854(-)